MGFGGGREFQSVVVAIVAYVLYLMLKVVGMGQHVQNSGGQLMHGSVKVLGAELDLPVFLAAGVPDFVDTAPAIGSAPSVRRYGDSRAGKFSVREMPIKVVKHIRGFLYDLRNL